ncbi:MAG TPA: hemerythrin family protein [Noviherbaspirillum sp.]|uniref:bacteriohemerythrin n=1 Tax=Noviherbaspirillum sp. TaxID=1926288 RepID=UPI002D44FF94|nr:hemerythrin family protein [Noviherbaspirillum sp.]HYD94459.1 hemerythrin family protein [Noviherbaspirillum sp.]
MQSVKWSQEMSLGVKEMDAAHRIFLDELTELLTTPDDKFGPAFLSMVAKIEQDFREEEQLMEEIDYAGIAGHREQHARVLGALHHVAPHVMNGDIALGREAAELLPQWFLFHLSTMDTALAFALDADGGTINPPTIRLAAERIRQGADRPA